MNKNAIQNYAIWARNELIEQVKQRAYQYGISDKGYGNENATVIAGRVLSAEEKQQRHSFVTQIKEHGYQQAVEEVAYTWFNRFIALRFMEVNDYLPTHIRVFSDASGGFNPEIMKDVLQLDLEGLDKTKVSELLNANQTEELYRYLLLTQCNALNAALPEMFERLGSYTEMLLPNNILKQDGVLGRLVTDIPEEDFRDAVQIIGWMYQYYNTEPKAAVFARPPTEKIKREEIPAATQLFTPDWIVRYMVENSLGRLWLESHPNPTLKASWKYYLDEAEQTTEVAEKLSVLRSQSPVNSPEDIRLIDPCMGSGHILVYAFDVLIQIYESEGYNPREAAKFILEKNIYGLDIDRRAYQLAYFSLMIKARQYNRRIFGDNVKPRVYHPAGFHDGEEYGSLVKVDILPPMPVEKAGQLTFEDTAYDKQFNAWNFKLLLAQKYDVVVTNPPYAGSSGVNSKLVNFLKEKYPNTKSDMFAAFIEQCCEIAKAKGYIAMITQQAWMFLSSYEKLRTQLFSGYIFNNMIHLGNGTFGFADFGLTTFVLYKSRVRNYRGTYFRLVDNNNPEWKETEFLKGHYCHIANTNNFAKIPGCPVAYWVGMAMLASFSVSKTLIDIAEPRKGLTTAKDSIFLRYWYEVNNSFINFKCASLVESENNEAVWYPLNKGGVFRRWFGNNEYVIKWYNNGEALRNFQNSVIRNEKYYFRESISWNDITAYKLSFRYKQQGQIFNDAGPSIFASHNKLIYLLAFGNSKVAQEICYLIAPTIHYTVGQISSLPVIITDSKIEMERINKVTLQNIDECKADWDSFEISWDFKHHPLICGEQTVAAAFSKWECETQERFDRLKSNEEELNSIFIDIYGLQHELTPEVEAKDVTVRLADLGRDIRSLISYAVGCMFGRYSLNVEDLAFAGGNWDTDKYKNFIPDNDNIIPICDDEYFDDDIVGRFVDFIRVVYGAETLEGNLKYIADALYANGGTPRERIRRYFLNDFYNDHCKIYKKCPIYWLFDSGKKSGFKALIYLHRYSSDLLAKLRTDYVHEQQERYRTQLSHIASALNTATGADRARLLKQQDKMTEQLKETTAFEEKVHHLADQNIEIDLDDGVKKNYEIFKDVLAKK